MSNNQWIGDFYASGLVGGAEKQAPLGFGERFFTQGEGEVKASLKGC